MTSAASTPYKRAIDLCALAGSLVAVAAPRPSMSALLRWFPPSSAGCTRAVNKDSYQVKTALYRHSHANGAHMTVPLHCDNRVDGAGDVWMGWFFQSDQYPGVGVSGGEGFILESLYPSKAFQKRLLHVGIMYRSFSSKYQAGCNPIRLTLPKYIHR